MLIRARKENSPVRGLTVAKRVHVTVRRQPWRILLALGVAWGLPADGWCQKPDTTRDRTAGRRELAVAKLLQGLDRNRDGVLQPEEIPRRAKLQVAVIARRRGLDLKKPLPLAELTRSIDASRAKPAAPSKPAPTEASGEPVEQPKPAAESDSRSSDLVPGFGVPDNRTRVPGFGAPPPALKAAKTTTSDESQDTKESASSTPAANAKLRRLAKSMLAQYDKNKSGQLEREEWSRMRGKPKEADRNGDGVLSLDELADHLAGYGSRRKVHAGPRSSVSHKASNQAQNPDGTRRTFRFLSPHERLPKGLPDWFVPKDANLDGQVSMAEFSSDWPWGKLQEFARHDLNGDGLIVPKECLRATATR
jgi:hypothetical protein